MKIVTNSIPKGLMIPISVIFLFQLLVAGICDGRIYGGREGAKSLLENAPAAPVRLDATDKEVVLDNGILQVTIAVPGGYITGIRFGGLDNLLNPHLKESDRGYWDMAAATGQLDNDDDETDLVGTSYKVIKQTEDHAEISFICPQTASIPAQVDKRYIMLRGSPGFYSYAIFERKEGLPPLTVGQIRAVLKLDSDKFHYMAVSDKIQRVMPMPQDRETGEPLDYKEAVLLTKPTNPEFKGQVDDKYQYSLDDKDNKVNGWISFDPAVGIWIITPSDEFRLGGPLKQDLTSHVGPTLLEMFHSTHYVGKDLDMSLKNGEPWKKVFGPYFVHVNSLSGKGDPRTLWQKAKDQMLEEVKRWPYDFALSEDFPKANQRGSVVGRLLVNDGKAPNPANSSWVGLAAPGNATSWQTEMKGYQFWTQADGNGNFQIKNVREGTYSLYAWVPGFIGDFKSEKDVVITPGKEINLGELVYKPPRVGPTLWEIGIPDRTAAEFFVPDPSPRLTNPLFLHDEENKYRQYGLWELYTDLYPKDDLTYTVGKSDYKKDWFFAHVNRGRKGDLKPATWKIVFPLQTVAPNADYTLQIALAAANQAELQVRINNPDLAARPLFTTLMIGRDNAIARHGIHGLYRLYSVNIPSSLLKTGDNTVFLTQPRVDLFRGFMYDYIRLEGPPSSS